MRAASKSGQRARRRAGSRSQRASRKIPTNTNVMMPPCSSSKAVRRTGPRPLTAFVGVSTIAALVIFVLSMSPRPFLLHNELSGSWMVEPQGTFARRALTVIVAAPVDDITCQRTTRPQPMAPCGIDHWRGRDVPETADVSGVATDEQQPQEAGSEDTLDKTRDNEYSARCVIPIGHFNAD